MRNGKHIRSLREYLLQSIGRCAAESARQAAHEIMIDGSLGAAYGKPRIGDILRSACEALHRDKILPTDDAQRLSAEGHIHRALEDLRVKPP